MGDAANANSDLLHVTPGITEPIKIHVRKNSDKKTLLRFFLHDGTGAPCKGEPYRVHLDGAGNVKEGTLPDDGQAKVEGLEPGEYYVVFPQRVVDGKQVVRLKTPKGEWTSLEGRRLSTEGGKAELSLPGALLMHRWFEYHEKVKERVYAGTASLVDDVRVVDGFDKRTLHLCFLEKAVSTVWAMPDEGQWLWWRIEDASGAVVLENPKFSQKRAASVPKKSPKLAWAWDGRVGTRFAAAGTYRSVAEVFDRKSGASLQRLSADLTLEGDPLKVFVRGVPKDDAAMRQEHDRRGAWIADTGRVFTTDCWIEVRRGKDDPDHTVFLGHGAIEASAWEGEGGALGTPQGRDYKGIVKNRKYCGRELTALEFMDLGPSGGVIKLDPHARNPYRDGAPGAPEKVAVQAHPNEKDYCTNGTSVGCTTVTDDPRAAVRGGLHNPRARFGSFHIGDEGEKDGVPIKLRTKQTDGKAEAGAPLVADDHAAPAAGEACPHMQETCQAAMFGGFRRRELPLLDYGISDEPDVGDAPRVRYRMTLDAPARESIYFAQHHAVVFAHERAGGALRADVPFLVIRTWNRERLNLLVRGKTKVRWFIRDASTGAVVAHLLPPPKGTNAAAPLGLPELTDLPADQRLTAPLPPLPAGRHEAVLEYRVRLFPKPATGAKESTWVAEKALRDPMSSGDARLEDERLEDDHLVGASVLEL